MGEVSTTGDAPVAFGGNEPVDIERAGYVTRPPVPTENPSVCLGWLVFTVALFGGFIAAVLIWGVS